VEPKGRFCVKAHEDERRSSTEPEAQLHREALTHADALYNLARYLTGKDADAEDLVQEAYTRAFAASGRFIPGTNLRAWLFTILRNLFLDSVRQKKRAPRAAPLDADDVPAENGSFDALRGDAELERLRSVVAEEIEDALMALTPDARTVVLLDLEGLSEVEMADVLDCAPGTVKSRLSRARAALRRLLVDYAREGSK
jgi:RNA polymerase sigma-70 factor (ECF subfamily)